SPPRSACFAVLTGSRSLSPPVLRPRLREGRSGAGRVCSCQFVGAQTAKLAPRVNTAATKAQVSRLGGPSLNMSRQAAFKPASFVQLGLTLCVALALTFVLTARTASAPILSLGPIAVADGTATVVGTVGHQAVDQTLTVNGQPVGIATAGHFSASVHLNGASSLDFQLADAAGQQTVGFYVPLTGA